MAKKDKSINPADAHRRAQHKKEVKKNKLERKKLRDQNLLQKDPSKIAADIAKYTRIDEEGRLDAAGKQKLQRLITGKQKIDEARKEASKSANLPDQAEDNSKIPKDPTRSLHYHPTLNPFGIPPPGQAYQEIDSIKQGNEETSTKKDEGSNHSGQSDWDSLSDSEDSEASETGADIEIEIPEANPDSEIRNTTMEKSTVKTTNIENPVFIQDTSKSEVQFKLGSLPPLPPGTPPPFAISSIPGIEFLPSLPLGPPPPTALMIARPPLALPVPLNNIQPPPQLVPGMGFPRPFLSGFGHPQPLPGFPPHFPPFAGQFPPHLPPGPILEQNNVYAQMPPPQNFQTNPSFHMALPPPPGGPPVRAPIQAPPRPQNNISRHSHQGTANNYKGQVDILSQPAEIRLRTSSHSSQSKNPPKDAIAKVLNPAEGSVISAEPKLRDLKKELTALVPTSLLRKRTKVTANPQTVVSEAKDSIMPNITPSLVPSHSVGIRLFRPKINAAPDLGDEDSTVSSMATPVPLISSGPLFPAKPTPPVAPTSTSAPRDEYDAFMKEMEGLL